MQFVFHDPRLSSVSGGAESVTLSLAEALAAGGHQLTLVMEMADRTTRIQRFISSNPEIESVEVSVITLQTSNVTFLSRRLWHSDRLAPQSISFGQATREFYATREFDLVIVSLILDLAELDPSCPVLLNVFGLPPDKETARLERPLLNKVSAMTFASEFVRNRFAELFDLPDQESIGPVVHAGIDDVFFWESPKMPKRFDLCFAGRLVPRKGLLVVLQALATLRKEGICPSFAIAGSGPQEGALLAAAASLGVESQITWVGTTCSRGVRELLDQSRIFIYATVQPEAFGLSNLEAMARGLPVVTTNLGGEADYVVPGQNALVCEPEDPQSLAEVIRRLLESKQLRERLGDFGRQTASRFAMEKTKGNWLEVIERIVGPPLH